MFLYREGELVETEKNSNILINETETVYNAMQLLNTSSRKILFIAEDSILKAALSDGDIRRWLLKKGSLDAPVKNVANYQPKFLFDGEREIAKTYMRERRIDAVPIVDDNLRIIDIVFSYEDVDLSKVVIRELRIDDLPMVLEFFDQMAGDTRAMFNRGDINRIRVIKHFNNDVNNNEIHFGAIIKTITGELMVGYIFLWDLDTKIPWLGIAVREDWKGYHLGRILMGYLDQYAEEKDLGGLILTTVPANIRAHTLYSRMGYEYYGLHTSGEYLYIKRFKSEKGKA